MRDTSLLDDLHRDRKRRKNQLIRRLLVGIPLTLIAVISVTALADTNQQAATNKPDNSTTTESSLPPSSEIASDNKPQSTISDVRQTKPTASNSPADYSAINATLCNDMKGRIQSQNESYLTQYADNQKYWTELYRGSYETPEALQSKQYYIDYTKGRFDELRSSSGPSLQKVCGTNTSINEVLLLPDYSAWR